MTQAMKVGEFGLMRQAELKAPLANRFQWNTLSEETSMGKFIGDYLERGALDLALLMIGSGMGLLLLVSQTLAFLVKTILL